MNDSAVELLVNSGLSNIERFAKALDEEALLPAIGGGICSAFVLERSLAAMSFSGPVTLLPLVASVSGRTRSISIRGIPVFSARFSNTRSVAELVIGGVVMLLRRIFPRSAAAHEGGWNKSATDSQEA